MCFAISYDSTNTLYTINYIRDLNGWSVSGLNYVQSAFYASRSLCYAKEQDVSIDRIDTLIYYLTAVKAKEWYANLWNNSNQINPWSYEKNCCILMDLPR